jgi:dihydrolipoamide dehydrogenase
MAEPALDSSRYDVVVIGGGPAGYVCAIRAAQNGLRVACIDSWQNRDGTAVFGGTCLNAGCIPSKALLESSELLVRARTEFASHGIRIEGATLDLQAMQARKSAIVKQFSGGIQGLFKANGVTGLFGRGHLLPGNKVRYTPHAGTPSLLEAEHVVLATGSTPIELPFARFDGERVLDSWGALDLAAVPERLGVIGGGVIGLELGSVWSRLGSQVVVLEALDQFLSLVDGQVAKEAQRQFKKQGLDIRLGARVSAAAVSQSGVRVDYADERGQHVLEVDQLVVAVGRRPATTDLLDPLAGVTLTERGFIDVDDECRTAAANVWAIGDVVRGPMLAHKGSEEGVMVADLIANRAGHVNYEVVPSVIYTAPEIAWVGRTEEQLNAAGVDFKAGTFNFAASGRARAMEQAHGLVKILADVGTDRILGVHIVGPLAGELIAEAVLAMEFEASAEDLQRTMHAHPTLAEAMHEAALATDRRALHAVNH